MKAFNLDAVLEEMLGLEAEDMADIYKSFLTEIKDLEKNIQEKLFLKDWEKLRTLLHTIKGMSGNLRVDRIFTKAKLLEQYLIRGEINNLEEGIGQLSLEIIEGEKEIKEAFALKKIII